MGSPSGDGLSLPKVDLAEANRRYWDTNAKTVFQQDWVRNLAKQVTDGVQTSAGPALTEMRQKKQSERGGESVKLLDYACGNGVVSHALAADADVIRGVDISQTMVDSYNQMAQSTGFPKERMFAVVGDITSADESRMPSGPEWSGFDAVVMSMALHHVTDPQLVVSRLVDRLRTGGIILIVDWEPHGSDAGSDTAPSTLTEHGQQGKGGPQDTIAKPSFTAEDMRALFTGAGCDPDSYTFAPYHDTTHIPESTTKIKGGVNKRFFVAKATKL